MIHDTIDHRMPATGVSDDATMPTFVRMPARGVLGVGGPDAREFLQNLVSNDIQRLDGSHALYALLLTAQGKFLFDFFLAEATSAPPGVSIVADCEGPRAADLLRRLTLYRLHANVTLADVGQHYAVAAVFGGDAAARIGLHADAGSAARFANGVAFVDPRMPELGARVIAPATELEAALAGAGLRLGAPDAYERLRLALGVPDGSRDLLVDKTFPLEGGLDDLHAIDYDKGCYVGQELTARTHYRGTIRKRLFRVDVEGPLPAPGTEITFGGVAAGEMRSGAGARGIAMLRLEHVDEAERTSAPFAAGGSTLRAVRPPWFARTPATAPPQS